MNKEEFNQNYIEQYIFNELKDCGLKNSEYIKRKYQGLNINYSRLYRRIINYQIKVYGYSLNGDSSNFFTTKDYYKKAARNHKQRSYERRKRYDKEK